LIKALGVLFREQLPFPVLRALAYGTIVIEALGALSIASPVLLKYTRAYAVISMPLLHLGFELCLDLGVFSFAMMSFYPLLLLPEHWAWLAQKAGAWHRRRIVYFDASCGICFWIARTLARLDAFERLSIRANTEREGMPAGMSAELLDSTILVVDSESGRAYTRARAVAQILRSLPGGFLVAVPMQLPGLVQLAEVFYDRVAQNRARISQWLGMAACGLPSTAPASVALPSPESEAAAFGERLGRVLGEACVALVMAANLGEVLNANAAVPRALRYRQPELLQAIVEYPRTFQGWRMFAPHAPLEDFNIEVDAVTLDGRHVDPYNEVASRVHAPSQTQVAPLLQQDQFFTAYSLFIWRDHFRAYRTAFEEWILRYPQRTERPRDRIVRFTVYKLSDTSPPPGKLGNTNFKREPFMRWPNRM
jgi:predicted DCC family thiol-disulfide oxidoreductase YuxK